VPIVLYTYANPLVQFGWREFHEAAAQAGVDGLLILDLPPDEDEIATSNVHHIRLVAPTTGEQRIGEIVNAARGFIYYVSREGVTGGAASEADGVRAGVDRIRAATNVPVAVGFGVSNAEQAKRIAAFADGVVVGSAIVKVIAQQGVAAATHVHDFAKPIAEAIHSAVRG
jgi:tryptophan synthase alpha chain